MSNKQTNIILWIIGTVATIAATILSEVGVKLIDTFIFPPSNTLAVPEDRKIINEVYPDKSHYEGDMSNGMRNGSGTYTAVNGEKYTGDWLNDKRHGFGVYVWANGDEYRGEWQNDLRHGKGRFKGFDGLVMDGLWENDRFVTPSQF